MCILISIYLCVYIYSNISYICPNIRVSILIYTKSWIFVAYIIIIIIFCTLRSYSIYITVYCVYHAGVPWINAYKECFYDTETIRYFGYILKYNLDFFFFNNTMRCTWFYILYLLHRQCYRSKLNGLKNNYRVLITKCQLFYNKYAIIYMHTVVVEVEEDMEMADAVLLLNYSFYSWIFLKFFL